MVSGEWMTQLTRKWLGEIKMKNRTIKGIDDSMIRVLIVDVEDGMVECRYDHGSLYQAPYVSWVDTTGRGETDAAAIADYHRSCHRLASA